MKNSIQQVLVVIIALAIGFAVRHFTTKPEIIKETIEVVEVKKEYRDTCATNILIDSIKIYTEIREQKVAAWRKLQGEIIAVKEDTRPLPCSIDTSTVIYATDEGLAHIKDTITVAGAILSFTRGISVDTFTVVKEVPVVTTQFETIENVITKTKTETYVEKYSQLYWLNSATYTEGYKTGLGMRFKNNLEAGITTSIIQPLDGITLNVNIPLFKFNKKFEPVTNVSKTDTN